MCTVLLAAPCSIACEHRAGHSRHIAQVSTQPRRGLCSATAARQPASLLGYTYLLRAAFRLGGNAEVAWRAGQGPERHG